MIQQKRIVAFTLLALTTVCAACIGSGAADSATGTKLPSGPVGKIGDWKMPVPQVAQDPLSETQRTAVRAAMDGASDGMDGHELEQLTHVQLEDVLGSEKIRNGKTITNSSAIGRSVVVLVGANGFCTGQVINRWFVLTAAHCIADLLSNGTGTLLVGFADSSGNLIATFAGTALGVTEPSWSFFGNDTGLIFLATTTGMNTCQGTLSQCTSSQRGVPVNAAFQYVRPGIAPFTLTQYPIVGYGTIDNVNGAGGLRTASMPRALQGFLNNNAGYATFLSWSKESDPRPCGGDSGSPLVPIAADRLLYLGMASRITNDQSDCSPSSGGVGYSGLNESQAAWVITQVLTTRNQLGLGFKCSSVPGGSLSLFHCDNDGTLY